MEKWNIFLSINRQGLLESIDYINKYLKQLEDVDSRDVKKKIAIVCPPANILNIITSENLGSGVFSWTDINDLDLHILNKLLENENTSYNDVADDANDLSIDSEEFISDCIHQLVDELPQSNDVSLQVIYFNGKYSFDNKRIPFDILCALKRLEVWNDALMLHVSVGNDDNSKVLNDYVNFRDISHDQLNWLLNENYLWSGEISFMFNKRCGKFCLNYAFLESPSESDVGHGNTELLKFTESLLSCGEEKFIFDKQIQVGCVLRHEDIPFHIFEPIKYQLKYHPSWTSSSFDPFKLTYFHDKHCWFLAFLGYDCSTNRLDKKKSNGWFDLFNQKLIPLLSRDLSNRIYKSHQPMILRWADDDCLDVYFFRHHDNINQEMNSLILQQIDELKEHYPDLYENGNNIKNTTSPDGFDMINFNAASRISMEDWYERLCWETNEDISKVYKSIARYDSNELMLKGFLKPPDTDNAQQDRQSSLKDRFTPILQSFDTHGNPVCKILHPVPIIPDRLLQNIKTEHQVKTLNYDHARSLIGHGLEYCSDSMSSIRLDSRLIKVQKRFIADDTLNLSKSTPKILLPNTPNELIKIPDEHEKLLNEYSLNEQKKLVKERKKSSNDELKLPREHRKSSNDELKLSKEHRKSSNDELKLSKEHRKSSSDELKLSKERRKSSNDELKLSRERRKSSNDELKLSRERRKSSIELTSEIKSRRLSDSESRSERHIRRLKFLISGVIVKYGATPKENPLHEQYCDDLFKVCLPLVKKLKSSKGLCEQMKAIIKENVSKVIRK